MRALRDSMGTSYMSILTRNPQRLVAEPVSGAVGRGVTKGQSHEHCRDRAICPQALFGYVQSQVDGSNLVSLCSLTSVHDLPSSIAL